MVRGRDDRDRGPADEPGRPYVSPPNIRTTGELPAVTGEIDRSAYLPPGPPGTPPSPSDPRGHGGPPSAGSRGGSVVDRPPAAPPDWMSGVEVPELIVTREIGRHEPPVQERAAQLAQRVLGLVLVALLVAAVALVAIGSIFGFR